MADGRGTWDFLPVKFGTFWKFMLESLVIDDYRSH